MIGGDEMDLSDDESNLKKAKTKTDPIQLQVIIRYIIMYIIFFCYFMKILFCKYRMKMIISNVN